MTFEHQAYSLFLCFVLVWLLWRFWLQNYRLTYLLSQCSDCQFSLTLHGYSMTWVWLITQSGPIGPNRTTSDPTGPHRDPIGPHRTLSHSTSYFLPPTTGQSFILSLVCTLQTRSIIDIQEKLPTSTQLRRIQFKAYSLLVSKVCADCAELRHSEQLWTETTSIECTYLPR